MALNSPVPVNSIDELVKLVRPKLSNEPEANSTFWISGAKFRVRANDPVEPSVLPKNAKSIVVSVISTNTVRPDPPAQFTGGPMHVEYSIPGSTITTGPNGPLGLAAVGAVTSSDPLTEVPISPAVAGDASARLIAATNPKDMFLMCCSSLELALVRTDCYICVEGP
jgi:hypothetical protein